MTTTSLPLSLSNDLLTGSEWNSARVEELFQLSRKVKTRPDHYGSALAG